MIKNLDNYNGVALWQLYDLDDGIIGYFKTENAVLNYIKKHKLAKEINRAERWISKNNENAYVS